MAEKSHKQLTPEQESRLLALDECYIAICDFYNDALTQGWPVVALCEIEKLVDKVHALRVKK